MNSNININRDARRTDDNGSKTSTSQNKVKGKSRKTEKRENICIKDCVEDSAVSYDPLIDYPAFGPKKKSAVGLLNFRFPERRNHSYTKPVVPKPRRNFNGEHFINANYQVVLKHQGNDVSDLKFTDSFDWSLIEEIRLFAPQCFTCPICLDYPSAGQITRCGHVFCWPCLLRYFSVSESKWSKCPICGNSITKLDSKSFLCRRVHEFVVGDQIEMCLMYRSPDSTFIQSEAFTSEHSKSTGLNKFITITTEEIMSNIIKRERQELDERLESDIAYGETSEVEFDRMALKLLAEREMNVLFKLSEDSTDANKLPPADLSCISTDNCQGVDVEFSACVEHDLPDSLYFYNRESDCDKRTCSELTPPGRLVYFYQSNDGQPIFLHSFNVNCLLTEFESFEKCPLKITGRILSSKTCFLSEENRHKFRYLSHLPLGCEICLVELDLLHMISLQTFEQFQKSYECRRKREKAKKREESMNRRKNELREKQMINKLLSTRTVEYSPAVVPATDSLESFPMIADTPQSTRISVSPPLTSSSRVLSFAEILRDSSDSGPMEFKRAPFCSKPVTKERNDDTDHICNRESLGQITLGSVLEKAFNDLNITNQNKTKKGRKKWRSLA